MPFVFRIREQLLYKGANHEVSASARISIRQQSPSFPRHILREYIHAREEREMFTHKNSSRRGKNKLDSTQNERVERGKKKKATNVVSCYDGESHQRYFGPVYLLPQKKKVALISNIHELHTITTFCSS